MEFMYPTHSKLFLETPSGEMVRVITRREIIKGYGMDKDDIYYHGNVNKEFRTFKRDRTVYVDYKTFKEYMKKKKAKI